MILIRCLAGQAHKIRMIIKLSLMAILFVIVINLLKEQKIEFAVIVTMAASLILLYFICEYLAQIIFSLTDIINKTGIDSEVVAVLFRIVGTGYVCEFAGNVCEDFGNKSMADKISLAGKVIILMLTLPILTKVVDLILTLLN